MKYLYYLNFKSWIYYNKTLKLFFLLIGVHLMGGQVIKAQNAYVAPLHTQATFDAKTVNVSLPVGSIGGAGSVSSGAASYSIPLVVPPGTNGVVPTISLDYNSMSGNGLLGLGWNISGLSIITRVNKNIYHDGEVNPIDFSDNDRFALDGSRLISTNGTTYGADGATYATETENFATITSYRESAAGRGVKWFKVVEKDGTIMEYGRTDDSEKRNDRGDFIFLWRLNKIQYPDGNYITFSYDANGSESRIVEIAYTGNAITGLAPYNKITFSYKNRQQDKTFQYESGTTFRLGHLLDGIKITADNELVKSYSFLYGTDNVNTYLQEIIESGNTGEQLNSTVFKYGNQTSNYSLEQSNFMIDQSMRLFSGDFDGDGLSDVLAAKENYKQGIEYHTAFKIFKRTTPTGNINETLNFALDVDYSVVNKKSIPNGYNYLARDFDGDGIDDLITVKTSFSGSARKLDAIRLYKFSTNASSVAFQNIPIYVNYNKIHSSGNFIFTGDFNGDGIQDVLTMLGRNMQDNYAAHVLFGGNSSNTFGTVGLAGPANLDISQWASAEQIHVLDFNGDGKSDLLIIKGTTSEIFTFDSYSARRIYYSSSFPTKDHFIYTGDFNGDGKTDLLARSHLTNTSAAWTKAISDGKEYLNSPFTFARIPAVSTVGYATDQLLTADFNGDGKTDIFHGWYDLSTGSTKTDTYYSCGDAFISQQGTYNYSIGARTLALDLNGDGRSDLLNQAAYYLPVDIFYFNKNSKSNLLEKVKNGYGHTIEWNYQSLAGAGGIYAKGATSSYPLNTIQLPINVVSQFKAQNGIGGMSTTQYTYEGALLHKAGKGLLGFTKITTNDVTMDLKTVVESQLNSNYFVLTPYRETKTLIAGNTSVSQSLQEGEFINKGGKRFLYQVKTSSILDNLAGVTTTTTNAYDTYGNIISSTVSNAVETTVTDFSNYQAYGSAVPRLPKGKTVTKTRSGQSAFSVATSFNYTSIGQLKSQIDFDGLGKKVTTVYDYYELGNLKSTSVTPSGMSTRATSVKYDSKGRYAEISTNVLGQTSSATYDPKWGKPKTITGIDGLTTSNEYDAFGRIKSSKLPEGYTVNQNYIWAISGKEVYCSTLQHPGKPDQKTYYDVLGRQVRSQTEGMSGQWITQTQSYNAKAQVEAATEPYLEGQESPIITTTSYDEHSRPNSITKTGLGTTTISYTYDGGNLITHTTLPSQPTTTKTIDASGQIIGASDLGGTLTYTYYSHGGLREVKKDGQIMTSNEYDAYGKQTKLIDKNAGTTTYDYNAIGELISQTNAKGQTHTMQYDLLGRLEVRTGPEGTTQYEFYPPTEAHKPSLNQLKKVTGFVGNITEYTYDAYGRVKTQKQTVDGTAYTTTYDYNTYGDVTSTAYGSGFGTTHHYDGNGYLTKITSNGNSATLYQTASLDGLGQVKTYSLGNGKNSTITYDKRIPTRYYTAGIQDLNMNWDFERGNLNFRQDAIKNKKETFTYDALNRLITAQVEGLVLKQATYATSGNIETKSDVGTYTYLSTKPNAVEYVTNPQGVIPNAQQDITYTAFMQPQKVAENGYELDYTYGDDYERIKGILKQGGNTLYTRYYLGEYEKTNNKFVHYIGSPAGLIAIVVRENGNDTYHYTYTDHLGSILTVTNASGAVEAEQNFDAWGRRRNANTWDYANVAARPDWLYRGYTGHEHLDEFGLINMNGRLYDPVTGRMLSPDNYVQDPTDTQSLNRYSYAFNNPLRYNDPSGNISFSTIATWVVKAAILTAATIVTGGFASMAILPGAVISGTASVGLTVGAYAVAGAVGGAASGAIGALLNNGDIGRGILMGAVTGAITGAIGGYLNTLSNPLHHPDRSSLLAYTDPPTEITTNLKEVVIRANKPLTPLFKNFVGGAVFTGVALNIDGLGSVDEINRRYSPTGKISGNLYSGAADPFYGIESTIIGGKIASGIFAGSRYLMTSAVKQASKKALVQANKAAGDAFRDEVAELLKQEGRDVSIEVYKRTPFGKRYIDIEVSNKGTVLGGIETKVGRSPYTKAQRMKDLYLEIFKDYPVNLVRKPLDW